MTMLMLLKKLRQDENGVILSAEIVIIGSLLVIGLITGLTCLQQSVNGELRDVANAIGSLDQSYAFSAHRKPGTNGQCCAWTAGSSFTNCERRTDDCVQDVVGCQDILIAEPKACCSQTAAGDPCGRCGGCQSEGGGVGCGGCGGAGCGGCRTGCSTDGPRCIDTGVPKMKATEWRLPHRGSVVPQGETIIHSEPVVPAHDPSVTGEVIISEPVAEPGFEYSELPPVLSSELCPVAPVICEETARNNDLNIPDYVW